MHILRWPAVALRAGAIVSTLLYAPSAATSSQTDQPQQSLWKAAHKSYDVVRQMPDVPTQRISFETTEGTFINVDVSPDGSAVVFDLLGDVYQISIDGGDAVPLTDGMAWDQAPRFSPDGKHVYFVSDRVGYKNLWRMTLADRSLRQITNLDRDIVGGPNWSRRNNQLIVGIESSGHQLADKILHYIHPVSGAATPINAPDVPSSERTGKDRLKNLVVTFTGVENSDGEVFFSEPTGLDDSRHRRVRLHSFDPEMQIRSPLTPENAAYSEYKPQLSHGGEWLAYYRQYHDRRTELRIRNRRTGQDDCLIELADADDAFYYNEDSRPNYAFTPDDQSIVFWHDGKIQQVEIAERSAQIVPFKVAVEREIVERVVPPVKRIGGSDKNAIIRWPSLSNDRQTLVFVAIGYVWVMDMQSGGIRRLTSSNDFEYMPTISPDGRAVAYVSFSKAGGEYGRGRLMLADIHVRNTREVLADSDWDYLLPQWSMDGSKIAVIRQQVRQLGATQASFGWTQVMAGRFNEVASVSPAIRPLLANHVLHIGFDATGNKLLFSYPESKTRTILVAADVNGESMQMLAAGTPDVAGITPAPDLKHLALTLRDDSVRVVPFRIEREPSTVPSLSSDAIRVSNNSGYYVDWNDTEQLTFGFGTSVYKYHLKDENLRSLGVVLPIAAPEPVESMAFKGARLITMAGISGAGPVIENGTVVTRGNRIVAIGPTAEVTIPTDASVIDASGRTIVPGFLDTHYHRLGGYLAFGIPQSFGFDDKSALTFGITSAWDPASAVDVAPAGADLQLAGRTAGPRWTFSGAIMNYPNSSYLSSGFLNHYAQALATAESRGDLGATVLKDSSGRTRQSRQWHVAAARESGLGIVAHMEAFDGTMTRIVDGFTGGEHPSLPAPFYRDVQELLTRSGFIWTPNVRITWSSKGNFDDMVLFYCNSVLQTKKSSYREKLNGYSSGCEGAQRSPNVNYETHRISRVAEQVRRAADAGATIGVGGHNMPGLRLHQEMWYLWKGGMPVEDVLRATTMNNAEKLGLQEEVGSLEAGKVADFLVLSENPLDDILNVLSIEYTVQGGVVYDSSTAERVDPLEIEKPQQAQTRY